MDRQVAALIRAYLDLNPPQQDEFIEQINTYNRGTLEKKQGILNETLRVDMGPLSGTCPRCGR